MATRSHTFTSGFLSDFEPRRSTSRWLLAAILLGATVVRLINLGSGLWLDEILTYVNYARAPFLEAMTSFPDQNQHLMYTLLAQITFALFGESAWALRLPAVLFGVAGIWAFYLFAREVATRREALLGSALLALAYHHVWFSQNARGYGGMLFWTLLSATYFARALRTDERRAWLLFALTSALGVYTHMTMLFVIAGYFVTYLIVQLQRREPITAPGRWTGVIYGFVGAALLTLALYAIVLPEILAGRGLNEVSEVPDWVNPLWTVIELVRGFQIGFAGGLVLLAALGVVGVGIASFARSRAVVVWLFILPVVISATVVIAMGHHLWPRFFFFAMGFAVLIAIRGGMELAWLFARLVGWSPATGVRLGTLGCVAVILLSAISVPLAYRPKQDYGGALEFVETQRVAGEPVVAVGLAIFPYTELYAPGEVHAVTELAELEAIQDEPGRTWVLYTLPTHLRAVHPDIAAHLDARYRVVGRFEGSLGDGMVFVAVEDES